MIALKFYMYYPCLHAPIFLWCIFKGNSKLEDDRLSQCSLLIKKPEHVSWWHVWPLIHWHALFCLAWHSPQYFLYWLSIYFTLKIISHSKETEMTTINKNNKAAWWPCTYNRFVIYRWYVYVITVEIFGVAMLARWIQVALTMTWLIGDNTT